ncbi:hypothetical protein ACWDR0_00515 [Streptomyces sp. NPDC003691]
MFGITVSRPLSVAEVTGLFASLAPPGSPLVIQPPGAAVPDGIGSVWAGLEPTGDPAWPLGLVVHHCVCELGPYPDLRLAEHIAERFGADVLCGADPAFADVDPADPYYSLALVGGRWYLASTARTRLAGPSVMSGGRELPADGEPVLLIRPVPVDTA